MGRLFVQMLDAIAAGQLPQARALQARANEVIDVLIDVGVFPGTKAMLKLLGVDHKKMIYRHEGRDYRLTDVAGNVVEGLIA